MSSPSSDASTPDGTEAEMYVVAHRPVLWYLLRCGVDLFLDARYTAGQVDSTIFFRLNPAEKAAYEQRGDESLDELQGQIDDQMLWWRDHRFFWRDLSRGKRGRVHREWRSAAIRAWQGVQPDRG